MGKSKLKPSLEDTFAIGKIEGHKEAISEIREMIEGGASLETLQIYLKAKSRTLNLQALNNPFKQKAST